MKRIISLIALVGACSVAGAQTYEFIDLGTITGESHAFALGPDSVPVGSAADYDSHFVSVTYLPLSYIFVFDTHHERVAFSVDADGRIVVVTYDLGGMGATTYRYENWTATPLGNFAARASNWGGDIAGTVMQPASGLDNLTTPMACRYSGSTLTVLPTLGGLTGQGLGIDELGRVVGSSTTANEGSVRPAMWTGSSVQDLGTLGGGAGQAFAALKGIVVGSSQTTTGEWHATKWVLNAGGGVGSRVDLGTIPGGLTSFAHAINSSGDIVGTSGYHATLWHAGQTVDLNSLVTKDGWVLQNAWAISDSGVIAGSGTRLGFIRAFMLVPVPPCVPDYNMDGSADLSDVFDLANDIAMGSQSFPPNSPDFNADGSIDLGDVLDLANVVAGAPCP